MKHASITGTFVRCNNIIVIKREERSIMNYNFLISYNISFYYCFLLVDFKLLLYQVYDQTKLMVGKINANYSVDSTKTFKVVLVTM